MANVKMTYHEPTKNSDGTALDDLHHTSLYYNMGAGLVHVVDLPASLMTGGGTITYDVSVPVADGTTVNVDFYATATDTAGLESGYSDKLTKRVDTLAPAPPDSLAFI